MGRHRQPLEVAELKGADRANPQRYRREVPKSPYPLGDAPEHLDDNEKAAWRDISMRAIPGVLTNADGLVLEMGASLLAHFREDRRGFPSARLGHLVGILARLGLSPADRQKVGAAKEEKSDNPYDHLDD